MLSLPVITYLLVCILILGKLFEQQYITHSHTLPNYSNAQWNQVESFFRKFFILCFLPPYSKLSFHIVWANSWRKHKYLN